MVSRSSRKKTCIAFFRYYLDSAIVCECWLSNKQGESSAHLSAMMKTKNKAIFINITLKMRR